MGTAGLFKMTLSGAATCYIPDPNNNYLNSSRRVSRDYRGTLLRSGTIAVLVCNALHRLHILYDKPLHVECVHTFCLAGYWRWSALDSQRRGLFVCLSICLSVRSYVSLYLVVCVAIPVCLCLSACLSAFFCKLCYEIYPLEATKNNLFKSQNFSEALAAQVSYTKNQTTQPIIS